VPAVLYYARIFGFDVVGHLGLGQWVVLHCGSTDRFLGVHLHHGLRLYKMKAKYQTTDHGVLVCKRERIVRNFPG